MHISRTSLSNAVDRETVRSASKTLLAAGALLFVAFLVTLLPGVGRVVPGTPISFAALVEAVATVAVASLLLTAAPKLAALTRETLEAPREVTENVASVAYWLVILAAVLLAHRGLAGVVVPFLDSAAWTYDAGFFLLALPPVVFVAARLYAVLDPGADLIADRFGRADGADTLPNGGRTDASADLRDPVGSSDRRDGAADGEEDADS
ncbi:MAG: hypothetical protein ABEJ28_08395 [Salinigranum sp.]